MRFFALALSGLAAVSASVIPVAREHVPELQSRQTAEQIEATIAQAVFISQNLGSELERIRSAVANDPLLKLTPVNFNIPSELTRTFNIAISGIQALPTLTPQDNIPQYIATYYGPLINAVGESVFLTILQFKMSSTALLQNPLYSALADGFDSNIYRFTLALNEQFQGFTCGLSKSAGADTPVGQALKVVSDQTFYLLLDSIGTGNC